MGTVECVPPYVTYRGTIRSPGPLYGQVAYPLGSLTYSRTWVNPANPQSPHQVYVRALLTAAAQGYAALSRPNADAWRRAATGLYRTNAAGQTHKLTAPNLYTLINMYRMMDTQAVTSTPPVLTWPGAITSIDRVTVLSTSLTVYCTHSLADSADAIFVRVTAPLGGPARKARPNDYRVPTPYYTQSIVPASLSPQVIALGGVTLGIYPGHYIGVDLLPLGPTYWPGVRRRRPSILVESTT